MNGSVGRVIHLAFSLGMMRSPLEREHDLGVFKALSGAEQPMDCRGSQKGSRETSAPGDRPDPGIEPSSLALAGRFFTTSVTCEAIPLIALVFS